jgi:tellurite methyltransferase
LDLGCGSGRDSVYLNLSGWQVTGIDRLPEAINRARNLEMNSKELLIEKKLIDKNIQDIRWIVADIENEDYRFTGEYSLITSFFYLDRDVLKKVKNNLITGGSICIETFTPTHREKYGKPKRDAFLAFPNELPTLFPEFEILHYDEAWRGDKHTARLWAVKK